MARKMPRSRSAFGERLFALAHEPKTFVRFPDGGHNDLDDFGATAARGNSSTPQKADGGDCLLHSRTAMISRILTA